MWGVFLLYAIAMKVIFVCHGSICRSPAAECIFASLTDEFEVCSRAVSHEEIGNDIYPPMKAELRRRGIPLIPHSATHISNGDYADADYVFYMDESNRRRLFAMGMDNPKKTLPIFAFTPEITEVEDPWYSGRYELVCDQITQCCKDIIKALKGRG
jgi:protein-tyrosine phosphatase